MAIKVEEIITQRIIELLEKGTVPWHRPWKSVNGQYQFPPANGVSLKPYRGVNVFLLSVQSYGSPFWVTYKQAQQLGGTVRKGEKGTQIIFWKINPRTKQNEAGEEEEYKSVVLRYYVVFNLEQTEGCTLPKRAQVPVDGKDDSAVEFDPIAACEAVYQHMPSKPALQHAGGQAFYSKSQDYIRLPERVAFDSGEEYYSTLFHEMVHSTGAKHRLDRKTLVDAVAFGDTNYSKEELVAEMGASFLAGHTRIEHKTLANSAAYLAHWIAKLKSEPKLVITAASAAQKAVDFILDVKAAEQSQDEAA